MLPMQVMLAFSLVAFTKAAAPTPVFPPNWFHHAAMTTGGGHGPSFDGQNIVCTNAKFVKVNWVITFPGKEPSPFAFVLDDLPTPPRYYQLHGDGTCIVQDYNKTVFNKDWMRDAKHIGKQWWRGTRVEVFEGVRLYFGQQNVGTLYVDDVTLVPRGFNASEAAEGSAFTIDYLPDLKSANGGGGWPEVPNDSQRCDFYRDSLFQALARESCKQPSLTV